MIPKIIHYCWFGGKPLPASAVKCIASWKKFFPEYEIVEWNEKNYDVRKNRYISEAYDAKKYAFVSDYARFDILFHQGGLYFDTDVEVIKSFEDILENGPFMGCEIDGKGNETNLIKKKEIAVNPGLGIAAAPGLELYKEILDFYSSERFIMEDGTLNIETVVTKVTKILKEHGLKNVREIQNVAGITIYPKEFFNPMNNNTGKMDITQNTHSIHWYAMTWHSSKTRIRSKLTGPFHRLFGENCFDDIKKVLQIKETSYRKE